MTYEFELHNFNDWVAGLAAVFSAPVEKGLMQLPEKYGEGYVLAGPINGDMSYIIQHFTLNDALTLSRKKTDPYSLTLFFNQVQVKDFIEIKTGTDRIYDEARFRSNIFLSSTNYDLDITFSPGTQVRRVGICFNDKMIARYIGKDILFDLFLYTGQQLNNVNRELITMEYKAFLEDIFNTDPRTPLSKLILHNRILLLVETFFQSFIEKMEQDKGIPRKLKEHDLHGLQTVEQLLSNPETEKFPSIENLSKAAMMSTTKLKNRFKEVYGMKLYEFYNRNRLREARRLIESGQYSIKEAGYRIGFTNLSNFSKAFRKEFGFLPSALRENH